MAVISGLFFTSSVPNADAGVVVDTDVGALAQIRSSASLHQRERESKTTLELHHNCVCRTVICCVPGGRREPVVNRVKGGGEGREKATSDESTSGLAVIHLSYSIERLLEDA